MTHGTVKFNNKILKLMQEAYIAGRQDNPHYKALAIDNDGNKYNVFWTVYENWRGIENEDEMCDWENYEIEPIA